MHLSARIPIAATLLLTATTLASAASFQTIGLNAGVANISADGSTIVGTLTSGGGFMWTDADGLVNIGGMSAVGTSADGSVIAGSIMDGGMEKAARWTEATGWVLIDEIAGAASCDANFSSSFGIDDSGDVIVGLAWVPGCRAHGFRWENGVGSVDLGSTVVDRSSRANDVSGDGLVVVGWQDESTGYRQGAKWDGAVQSLFFDAGGNPVGEAHAATSDGSTIVGGATFSGNAWRWTGGPAVEEIGSLPGFNFQTRAWDVSNDGTVIVGFASFGFDRDAFIWLDGSGMEKLDDYLVSIGVTDASSIDLGTALGVSADGNIIAGWGFDESFNTVGWRIDRSGVVATPDVDASIAIELMPTQPNPFRASTSFEYTVGTTGDLALSIFDAAGRSVRTLSRGAVSVGTHTASWDGRDDQARRVAPGVYFIRATGIGSDQVGRVVLAR